MVLAEEHTQIKRTEQGIQKQIHTNMPNRFFQCKSNSVAGKKEKLINQLLQKFKILELQKTQEDEKLRLGEDICYIFDKGLISGIYKELSNSTVKDKQSH